MTYKMMMSIAAFGLVSALSVANAAYLITADPVQVDGQNPGDSAVFTIKITGITDGDLLSTEKLGYAPFTIQRESGDAVWASYVPDAAFENLPDEFTGANFSPVPTWNIGMISLGGVLPATSQITLGVLTVSAGTSSSTFSLIPDATLTAMGSSVSVGGSTFASNVVPEPAVLSAAVAATMLLRPRRLIRRSHGGPEMKQA